MSTENNIAIRVENLYKQYRLGVISHRTLYRELQTKWSKFTGKEDPNSLVLSNNKSGTNNNSVFWALNDVSFDVKKGEVLGIVGRNGAGKSTLLKILSRVTTPTKGEVKIKGKIVSLLEVGTGFHPELTGRENIFLNGAIMGMNKREIANKFDEIVAFAEIDKFIDTPVKRYSSGMYVRLAFAVAAHLEPDILIIDEVLAVGDAEFQKKCLGKMQSVSEQDGRTVLFVSHNMTAIMSLCTSCLYMKKGHLVNSGNPSEIINQYMVDSLDTGSKKSWNNSEAPGDGIAHLLSVRLINDQHSDLTITEIDKVLGVEIIYEIRSITAYNPIPSIALFTSSGDVACVSICETKEKSNAVGVYKAIAWIPRNILNNESYYLRVTGQTFLPEKTHFDVREALFIDVIEDTNQRKTEYRGRWYGALRPGFEWTLDKVNI